MKREENQQRKIRSDKKRETSVFAPTELYDWLAEFAYRTDSDLKPTVEALMVAGLESKEVADDVSRFFRREFDFDGAVYFGDPDRRAVKPPRGGVKHRIAIKLLERTHYKRLAAYVFALDVPAAGTAALLLLYRTCAKAEIVARVRKQLASTPRRVNPRKGTGKKAQQSAQTARSQSSSTRRAPSARTASANRRQTR